MSGFGKEAGPHAPPSLQPRFGNFSPPSFPPPPDTTVAVSSPPITSLPFPRPTPPRSPRVPEAIERPRPPSLAYQGFVLAASTDQSAGRPDAVLSTKSNSFASNNSYHVTRPQSFGGGHRVIDSSSGKDNAQKSFSSGDSQSILRPSAATSFVASRSSGTSLTAKVARFEDLRRSKSPPSYSANGGSSRYLIQTSQDYRSGYSPSTGDNWPKFPGHDSNSMSHQKQSFGVPHLASYDSETSLLNEVEDFQAPKRTRSPPIVPFSEYPQQNNHFAQKEPKRLSMSPPISDTLSSVLFNSLDSQTPQRPSSSIRNTPVESTSTRTSSFPVAKRTRASNVPSANEVSEGNLYSVQDDTEREIQAKARRLARFKVELNENYENISDIADNKVSALKCEQYVFQRQNLAGDQSIETEGGLNNANTSSDYEAMETSGIITGLCPDMCPESEREERERKGDLDQYERLEGDRNQTNKFLAVKKYNRTAEREASLIRPMEILQKTVNYLLSLLDQPYDDRFLGLYNFLWDRMRAIRMDLRMQHIFNHQAITMLEQMIRLHIAAMHELCEYTKGEGFSEGFDAHLNIEQMNKTSVELFQMYDDHRKKGLDVPTEKEFRGYYALLKLDKHPGYKVEPAELSLDLAKMTPRIRQTPEVLFARAVARACRTSNFIAFFRLARKATYLQACLMHAHFAKLRTQALASLHAGLQINQGLPVAHVAQWLAMENEDIESLLEYHGFSIKEFEEPYMVKEGPFINGGNDYPTQCSKLVHMKKSRTIVEDVSAVSNSVSLPAEVAKEVKLPDIHQQIAKAAPAVLSNRKRSVCDNDREMPDLRVVSSPELESQVQSVATKSIHHKPSEEDDRVVGASNSPKGFSLPINLVGSHPASFEGVEKPSYDGLFRVSPKNKMLSCAKENSTQILPRSSSLEKSRSGKYTALQDRSSSGKHIAFLERSRSGKHAALQEVFPTSKYGVSQENLFGGTFGYRIEDSISNIQAVDNSKDEELVDVNEENESEMAVENYEDEVALAKLKLIIRLWKRRTSKRKELRELRQVAAVAALNSLSLGPPIRQTKDQSNTAIGFDIDLVMRKRHEKYVSSWSRLNVSELIADVLSKRNPHAKCLCWKIILFSLRSVRNEARLAQSSEFMDLDSWLFSKLMPCNSDDGEDDLLVSSPGLSIWKKWIAGQDSGSLSCCLSVVKDVSVDKFEEIASGTSAVLFLVNASTPWNLQKFQLHKLLDLIPSGSSLPLLVVSGSSNRGVSDPSTTIVTELGLHEIDKSRVCSFSILFLVRDEEAEQVDGFFSDKRLREGLLWLASESPLQPYIQPKKTRDLVLARLNPSLDVLETMDDHEVGPNHCISVFNEALDWSLREIDVARNANPTGWPCPEISFLDDSYDEYMLVKRYLPSAGWSSPEKVGPLSSTVGDCKLPNFPDTISCEGANSGYEIQNLRSQLENSLITYLSKSSGMMGLPLAEKEAHVMIQRCARLEIHDSTYYIIPKWIKIFRRIFSWQLTRLSSGTYATAFVHPVDPTPAILDDFHLESNVQMPYLSHPSLDEVIDLSFGQDLSKGGEQQLLTFQPTETMIANANDVVDANGNDAMEDGRNRSSKLSVTSTGLKATSAEMVVSGKAAMLQADKLNKLLDQCKTLQDSLEKKLYVYF